jgi:hypothetical protein
VCSTHQHNKDKIFKCLVWWEPSSTHQNPLRIRRVHTCLIRVRNRADRFPPTKFCHVLDEMFTTLCTTRLIFFALTCLSIFLRDFRTHTFLTLGPSGWVVHLGARCQCQRASTSPRDSTEVLPVHSFTRARRWGSVRSWAGNSNRFSAGAGILWICGARRAAQLARLVPGAGCVCSAAWGGAAKPAALQTRLCEIFYLVCRCDSQARPLSIPSAQVSPGMAPS